MIPRTLFSSDHELFRDSVRKFLEQDAVPFHHQWEKDGHIDRALWNKAGEAGMLWLAYSRGVRRYGGRFPLQRRSHREEMVAWA